VPRGCVVYKKIFKLSDCTGPVVKCRGILPIMSGADNLLPWEHEICAAGALTHDPCHRLFGRAGSRFVVRNEITSGAGAVMPLVGD